MVTMRLSPSPAFTIFTIESLVRVSWALARKANTRIRRAIFIIPSRRLCLQGCRRPLDRHSRAFLLRQTRNVWTDYNTQRNGYDCLGHDLGHDLSATICT